MCEFDDERSDEEVRSNKNTASNVGSHNSELWWNICLTFVSVHRNYSKKLLQMLSYPPNIMFKNVQICVHDHIYHLLTVTVLDRDHADILRTKKKSKNYVESQCM